MERIIEVVEHFFAGERIRCEPTECDGVLKQRCHQQEEARIAAE